jgi:transcriptional regulator with XRE-family HTH domain
MPEFASPMLRRWELGNALRRIREERGMTIAEVTAAMREHYGSSFSTTKLSRMETAKRGVIPRDVHDLCMLYEVPDPDREHLVELAKSARGPEVPGLDEQNRGYLWFTTLEQVATGIKDYSLMFVPGLLQTADYARAVENLSFVFPEYYGPLLEAGNVSANADDRVRVRLERQLLLERENPLRLHALIDAAVLRRRLPEPETMRRQIEHLIRMSKRPHIQIQIIPFEAGLYPGSECSYWAILDFPPGAEQPPRTVYAEAAGSNQLFDNEADVNRMTRTFEVLSRIALGPDKSRAHMEYLLYENTR